MPSVEELSRAIIQSVEYGAYLDAEEVASAELPASSYPAVLRGLDEARGSAKDEIRHHSHGIAPDIDGWIEQARRLQADIQRSKDIAREIVRGAEAANALRNKVEDARSKVALLRTEVSFSNTLGVTLQRLRDINIQLDYAEATVEQREWIACLEQLERVDESTGNLGAGGNTRIVGLLRSRASELRAKISENVNEGWNALMNSDPLDGSITVLAKTEGNRPVDLNTIIMALKKMNTLDVCSRQFTEDLGSIILTPVLARGDSVNIEEDTIRTSRTEDYPSIESVLRNISRIIEFFARRLPEVLSQKISDLVMPSIIERLTSTWLIASLPTSLDELQKFQDIVTDVSAASEKWESLGWPGRSEILGWLGQLPRLWFNKRKEDTLFRERKRLIQRVQERRTVEMIETQNVRRDDVMMSNGNDDWDTAWDKQPDVAKSVSENQAVEDTEDTSAWNLDDEDPQTAVIPKEEGSDEGERKGEDAEEDEAWGWNEEGQDANPETSDTSRTEHESSPGEDTQPLPVATQRSLTLKETYTVTTVPDGIEHIIKEILADAAALSKEPLSQSPIAPAAHSLYSLPTLVLAMFRATSSPHYVPQIGGRMLLYNDSIHLSELLTSIRHSPASTRLNLSSDIAALQSFAKRTYGKEMESQRTILRDLLDGAQGFTNCTVPPFASECENAVAMTVDRIREVCRQWEGILSRSVLLQSLGSLLATVITKMITDIEDMSDISEAESKRLRHFCDEIAKLNDLFVQARPGGEEGAAEEGAERADMTGVYTPNWFKFLYLSEILEASLADIRYLWAEGELSLEFETEELVDLVKALFAESEHRRSGIREIRSRGR